MNNHVKITIPNGLQFNDLKLHREPDGAVTFDTSIINAICSASDINPELFTNGPEDNAAELIVAWYELHRSAGGAVDTTAEDLIAEVIAENERGGGQSYQPGSA